MPKGNLVWSERRPSAMSVTPATAPDRLARKSTTGTWRQPRKAPIIASIFTSPSPIPSTPVAVRQPQRTANSTPPPTRRADEALDEARRHEQAEREADARCPGSVMTFGRRCVSRSVPKSTTSIAVKHEALREERSGWSRNQHALHHEQPSA